MPETKNTEMLAEENKSLLRLLERSADNIQRLRTINAELAKDAEAYRALLAVINSMHEGFGPQVMERDILYEIREALETYKGKY